MEDSGVDVGPGLGVVDDESVREFFYKLSAGNGRGAGKELAVYLSANFEGEAEEGY